MLGRHAAWKHGSLGFHRESFPSFKLILIRCRLSLFGSVSIGQADQGGGVWATNKVTRVMDERA